MTDSHNDIGAPPKGLQQDEWANIHGVGNPIGRVLEQSPSHVVVETGDGPTRLTYDGDPKKLEPSTATHREDAFNEVLYGLGVLHRTMQGMDSSTTTGIRLALEYVKAMVEAEA